MAAIMCILGWKAQGLRCPDHEISCVNPNGNIFPVSIIQMPNGTGKTTILELLRAALSGAAVDPGWDRQKIMKYRKRNGDLTKGLFEVRLLLNEVRATIRMEFDFENGRVSYKTTHGPGQREGFNPPSDFRQFMNENFVNFFVFDGELAQNLLDRKHTDAQVVVENLFQINTFKIMARKVDEFWDSKTKNVSATEERGLVRRKNRLAKLKAHLRNCQDEQQNLKDRHDDLTAQIENKKDAYDQEIKKDDMRSQAFKEAKEKVDHLKANVREESLYLLERMRDPHALSSIFATSMLKLKESFDRVKLPESASREFFEDLADDKECVCGRSIDEEIATTIRSRATRYLGSEDVALLNSMKTTIKESVGDLATEPETDLNAKIAALDTAVQEERDARNDYESLRIEIEQTDPGIKNASNDINRLRIQIKDVEDQLEKYDSRDQNKTDDQTYGIQILSKRIDDAEKKLAEITHTLTEKAKRDKLMAIIHSAHEKSRTGITTELCKQANIRISELMPQNSISIERIAENLILEGQEGGSVGETLSIAYAFLATLFDRSEHQLPFVVDSPAGPIDLAVRPKIGELIPKLTRQFIAFTISAERERFISHLKRASYEDIQFITLFRKGSQELEDEAHEKGVVLETGDGLNVAGEVFFKAFQLDEEETL